MLFVNINMFCLKMSQSFNNSSYKYCFVPNCKNTTKSNPEKEFIHVPTNEQKRKILLTAAGVPEKKIRKTRCC